MTTEAVHDIVDKTTESIEFAACINGFHLEPRCRVCRNDQVRQKVNDLLATGASYAMISRALEEDNATLDKGDRVTIDSIRNHTVRHFPVQSVARATYRDILERRARENSVDFIKGVATAITPMAFYETVIVKGYETLVDSDTTVDVSTGMIAAGRLQALIDSRAGQPDMAHIMVQVTHIIEAVKSTVPREMWGEIVRKLDQLEQHRGSPDVETETYEADEAYDPIEFAEEDDEYDTVQAAATACRRCRPSRQRRGSLCVASSLSAKRSTRGARVDCDGAG